MPKVSAAFFATGVVLLIAGMMWGMHMGESEDFAMAPAHAHLNLLGWVTMGLYGTFYALTRESLSVRLAWTNWIVSTLGVVIMIPALALYLRSGDRAMVPPLVVGEVLTFIGLLIFGVSVLRQLLRRT